MAQETIKTLLKSQKLEDQIFKEVHRRVRGLFLSNTLKNMRLEHQSCRQEGNFNDRERLSRATHNGVWKLGAPKYCSGGYTDVRLPS
jgi:hypothetical protein